MIRPREHAQAYALSFPGAYAEHPWGQTVIKVKRKVFLFVNGAIARSAEGSNHIDRARTTSGEEGRSGP